MQSIFNYQTFILSFGFTEENRELNDASKHPACH